MKYKREGNYKKAIDIYKQLIALGSDDKFTIYYNLGKVLYLDGNYDESVQKYTIAIRIVSSNFSENEIKRSWDSAQYLLLEQYAVQIVEISKNNQTFARLNKSLQYTAIHAEDLMRHMGAALVSAGIYKANAEISAYLKTYNLALQGKVQLPDGPNVQSVELTLMQISWDYLTGGEPKKMMRIEEPMRNEAFFSKIVEIPYDVLLRDLHSEYTKLKGVSGLSPALGENGAIEFAATLLLWRYAVNKSKSAPDIYGSLMISLASSLGCAFNNMTPLEWSQNIEDAICSNAQAVSFDEFGSVYRYLKHNIANEIRAFEFAKYDLKTSVFYDFMDRYNSAPGFGTIINHCISQGLGFKDSFWFQIVD